MSTPLPEQLQYDVDALVARVLTADERIMAECWDCIRAIASAAIRVRWRPIAALYPLHDPRPEAFVWWLTWSVTGAITMGLPIPSAPRELLGPDVVDVARLKVASWRTKGNDA